MSNSRTVTVTAEDRNALIKAVIATEKAANGGSNDREIQSLQDALDRALGLLGISDDELDAFRPQDDG